MSTTQIKDKAKWTFQELIPIILFGALGLFGVYMGLTGGFSLIGAIILVVVGFGFAIFIFRTSYMRKRNSTLVADFENDEDYSASFWMRKPIKDKWRGKLDEGKNKGKLATVERITIENIKDSISFKGGSTRTIIFNLPEGKKVYLPTRLIKRDDVRKYIADAIAKQGGKVKFDSKADSKEFQALLTGQSYTRKQEDEAPVKKNTGERNPLNAPVEKKDEVDESLITPKLTKEPRRISYEAYRTISAEEAINNAVAQIDLPDADANDDINGLSVDSLRKRNDGLLGGNNTSISIDLGTAKKE